MLKVYNTLHRKKEVFQPIDPAHITMYVCGPTVYDRAHIGNARPAIVFDVLYRVLKALFPKVTYARNITDIDDKINKAAAEKGVEIKELTRNTTKQFLADMDALNVAEPDIQPHATDHVGEIIALCERLIDEGNAYVSEGHVMFAIESMPQYGALSNRTMDELQAGARVEVGEYKKHPGDFVMWKPSSDDLPGWESPWGRGRPGWHIECTAMIHKHLGKTIDIHGGGHDLVFPHHENEIAQGCCAYPGEDYVKTWMHNGMVMVNGEKMSKSLGNFLTLGDILQQAPGEAARYMMLQTHYRQPLNWTNEGLLQAKAQLDKFYLALNQFDDGSIQPDDWDKLPDDFKNALLDDLNTPVAIQILQHSIKALHKAADQAEQKLHIKAIKGMALMLGILQHEVSAWLQGNASDDALTEEAIDALLVDRQAARASKDFAKADLIRDQLSEAGVIIEDSADGTTWRRE